MSAVADGPDPVLVRLDEMIGRLDVICAEAAERDPDDPAPEVERELEGMMAELRRILDAMMREG